MNSLLMKGMVVFGLVVGVAFMQGANLNAAPAVVHMAAFHGEAGFPDVETGSRTITGHETPGGLSGAVMVELVILNSGRSFSYSSNDLVDLDASIDANGNVIQLRLTYANATRTVNNCTDTGMIIARVSLIENGRRLEGRTEFFEDFPGCGAGATLGPYVGHGMLR